jgi:hypothetical protein
MTDEHVPSGSVYDAWRTSGEAAEHTCLPWLGALERTIVRTSSGELHTAAMCPGPVTLEDVVVASYAIGRAA